MTSLLGPAIRDSGYNAAARRLLTGLYDAPETSAPVLETLVARTDP